ncbi:MAG: MBOAT family O-acyltransferase, partial [Solirubrobacteraceae bacterium]
MLFPSVQFAIFFPIVLALSWALMSRPALWKPFIVVASYVFYAAANPLFCFLLGGVTLGNHFAARLIFNADSERAKRWICALAVAGDLGVLAVFKYYSFFAQSIAQALSAVSLGPPLPLLTIALPVGVSFFTFQAISYTVDVRRGLVKPVRLIDTALYLSFFPHLVAGPSVRAREFLPQLSRPRDPEHVAGSAGLFLVGMGLVKNVVIADYLG